MEKLDLSVFFQGATHVGRMIGGSQVYGSDGSILSLGNFYEEVAENRWTEWNPDPNAKYPVCGCRRSTIINSSLLIGGVI